MKLKAIELSKISQYRAELMGLAMLFVILFHVGLPRHDMFFGLKRMGNIGVDFFLFLSGMGLWFAWTKSPNTLPFLLKRILRVYPAWIIVACLYYIPDLYFSQWVGHSGHALNLLDLLGDIAINWGFWLHDELTFWYIPAIMMLYLFSPLYMRLIQKYPIYRNLPFLMMMWCIIVQYVSPLHQTLGHIEIFWSRVPIFFIGINMGERIKNKDFIEPSGRILCLIFFIVSLSSCIYLEQIKHGKFPLFLERMLYIPLTLSGIVILISLLEHTPSKIKQCLVFIGSISLELYLIHHHFILIYLEKLNYSYWITFFLTMAIATPIAWLLHKVVSGLTSKIERRLQ